MTRLASADGAGARTPLTPGTAGSERAAFREIFHLYFGAGRQDLARAVRKAQRLLESVSDPALRGKARRYVRALDSERKAGAA